MDAHLWCLSTFFSRTHGRFSRRWSLKILNACCPISNNKTRLFVPLTRNFDQTGDLEKVYAFNAQIFAEDQDMVESQNQKNYRLI